MIYLIGGAPRCGKTILSKQIAQQKNIPWISTDMIRSIVLACTPKAQMNKKFPYEKLQQEKQATPYQDVNFNPPRRLLLAEIAESKSLWPSIRKMIEHLIDCELDYVLEGVHLMPGLVSQLKGTSYWKQVKLVYLVKTDLDEIKNGFLKNTSKHDWLAGAFKNTELLNRVARMVQTKSAYITDQAKKHDFTVVDTGRDFAKKLQVAVKQF